MTKATGILAKRMAHAQAKEDAVLAVIQELGVVKAASIAFELKRDIKCVCKSLVRLRSKGRAIVVGRGHLSAWTLPDSPHVEGLLLEKSVRDMVYKADKYANRKSNEADRYSRKPFVHKVVPVEKTKVEVPPTAVRSVFELGSV